MRWFGNMGELRKPEGEKSSCGVASPLNRLPGVCVVVVKAPFELNGVDIACCGGGSDKNDDDDCLVGDLSKCSASVSVMGEASGESIHAPTARRSRSARLALNLVVSRKLRPDCLRGCGTRMGDLEDGVDGVDSRFEPRVLMVGVAAWSMEMGSSVSSVGGVLFSFPLFFAMLLSDLRRFRRGLIMRSPFTNFLFIEECHRFLMALSVLPGRLLAISAHLLPSRMCSRHSVSSSSVVQGPLLILGSRWLCHLSRHCFPTRPSRWDAMNDHFLAPYFFTSSTTRSSSSFLHAPLRSLGLRTFIQRFIH